MASSAVPSEDGATPPARAVVIWGTGTPRTMRVYWALHEVEASYDHHVIRTRTPDMDQPAFLAVSPGRKIPALQHGDVTITESGAITRYLMDTFGSARWTIAERALIDRWVFFTLTEIDATALYVLRRHRDLQDIYGAAPAAVDAAIGYLERQFGVVTAFIADGREFMVGGRLSEADIHLTTCCDWAVACDIPLPPPIASYHARLRSRAAYASAATVNSARP